jgi:hypothetical protein
MGGRETYEKSFFIPQEPGVRIRYQSDRGRQPHYAVLLEAELDGQWTTVRCWDNADSVDEHHMHRYSKVEGKQPATRFSHGTCNDARKEAIEAAKANYEAVIESWHR